MYIQHDCNPIPWVLPVARPPSWNSPSFIPRPDFFSVFFFIAVTFTAPHSLGSISFLSLFVFGILFFFSARQSGSGQDLVVLLDALGSENPPMPPVRIGAYLGGVVEPLCEGGRTRRTRERRRRRRTCSVWTRRRSPWDDNTTLPPSKPSQHRTLPLAVTSLTPTSLLSGLRGRSTVLWRRF
ncbi:hypothetical protein BDZ89DRAFT_603594 [Hymenopellis radicata]|nr:hypothetical protein BDZ89DRAFT_603594 [Hymenopellis radicata]